MKGGAAVLGRFHWLMYLFGAFLIVTGIKLYLQRSKEEHPEGGWVIRLARVATPLLMALILVEVTDVVFAVDSIPAIFAITMDPFIGD